jgi:HEPN domain-containing protein
MVHSFAMNRADLQRLAELRIREAKCLLDNKFFEGAYYLAGYAIECALKACIAKKTKEHDFPDLDLVRDSYKHDLQSLLRTAGLEPALKDEAKANPNLARYWDTVSKWSVDVRYEAGGLLGPFIYGHYANDLYSAIMDSSDGVLGWLKKYW